jgi:hypothetical protein
LKKQPKNCYHIKQLKYVRNELQVASRDLAKKTLLPGVVENESARRARLVTECKKAELELKVNFLTEQIETLKKAYSAAQLQRARK